MGSQALVQRTLFEKRTVELQEQGLDVEVRGLRKNVFFRVPFEHLPKAPVELNTRPLGWLTASGAAFLFTLLTAWSTDLKTIEPLFWLSLSALCLMAYRGQRKDLLVFHCKDFSFNLQRSRPSRETVDAFLKSVDDARDRFARMRDGVLDPPAGAGAELMRIKRLFRLGYIDAEEFETLKERIIGTESDEDEIPN